MSIANVVDKGSLDQVRAYKKKMKAAKAAAEKCAAEKAAAAKAAADAKVLILKASET